MPAEESEKKSSAGFRQTVVYNLAGFSFNLFETVLVTWLMFFYIPPENTGRVQYLSMGIFGLIMLGGRLLDAVTDPIIGYWSDNTRSRWGRRRPYIIIGSPVLLLMFVLAWTPPVEGLSVVNGVYLAVVLFFYYWAYTAVLIPWFAVLPEMCPDNRARVKVASAGVAIGVVGALVGGGLSGPLMQQTSVLVMALVLGIIGFLGCELTLLGFDERLAEPAAPPPGDRSGRGLKNLLEVFVKILLDRQVMSFSVMIVMVQLTYQLMMINIPYFATLMLDMDESGASLLIGKVIIIIALSTPLWYWLLSRFPKRRVMRWVIVMMGVGFFLSFFIGRLPVLSANLQAILIFSIVAVPMGGMFAAAIGLIADLTDYDELKTGERREAVYYGIYGIVRKTGWAFCSLITLGIYRLFGYSAANPMGVRVVWLACSVFCLIGLLAFRVYRIGDSREETAAALGMAPTGTVSGK